MKTTLSDPFFTRYRVLRHYLMRHLAQILVPLLPIARPSVRFVAPDRYFAATCENSAQRRGEAYSSGSGAVASPPIEAHREPRKLAAQLKIPTPSKSEFAWLGKVNRNVNVLSLPEYSADRSEGPDTG